MADEIYLMNDGKLVEHGTPEDIYNSPQETFSMQFLDPNDPIEGEIQEVNGDRVRVRIPGLDASLLAMTQDETIKAGDKCQFYIRPTDVEVASNGDAGETNVFDSQVELCAFQGSNYEIRFRIGEFSILGEVDNSAEVGESVKVRLNSQKVRGFAAGSST